MIHSPADLRQELHQLIESVENDKLQLMYDIVTDNVIPDSDDIEFTPEDIAEFDEIANSGEQCHTVEESMAIVRGKLKKQ